MRSARHVPGAWVTSRAFLVLVTWAVFGVGFLTAERLLGRTGPAGLLAGAACAAALWGAILFARPPVVRALGAVADRLERVGVPAWLAGCILLAAALRVAWVAVVPPVQVSDMGIYLDLARSLAERGVYEYGSDRVFLPPGLPLFLAPWVRLFGAGAYLPFVLNVLLAAGTILVVAGLARLLADGPVLRLATLLVAVWPNHVMLSGLASKELLVLFLLTLATLLYLSETEGRAGGHRAGGVLAAGLVLGAATLTQPSTLVLLPAFAALEALRRTPVRALLARLGLFVAGAIVAVSPWTVRNYLLFRKLVPVSANFGHSLLVGNHPGADGGFQPVRDGYVYSKVAFEGRQQDAGFRPVRDAYAGMDEIRNDRMAGREALGWIATSPRAFLGLVPRKQILFLGDDADGAYHALKWGLGVSDVRYVAAKAACSAFWLAVLALIGVSLYERGHDAASDPRLALLMLFWFCLLALLSVTESGARHHIALSGFGAILASLAVLSNRSQGPGFGPLASGSQDRVLPEARSL